MERYIECVTARSIAVLKVITLCAVLSVFSLYSASAATIKTSKTGTRTSNDVVTVTSPASGAIVASGFTVNATARPSISGATIAGMIVWLDGVQYGPVITSNTVSVQVNTTVGGHSFGVSAWDTAGATGFSPTYPITVQASSTQSSPPPPAPSPTNDIVTITSPASGATVASGFTVNATAQPSTSGATIAGMILWLDGVQYGPIIPSNTLSVQVNTTAGAHSFGVSAWDNAGASGFSPTYPITVQASSTQSLPPPSAPSPSQSSGTSFYVDPNGSDTNPGTLSAPWLTIQHAMNSATPGSTVNIRGGTYHERLSLNVSGSVGNYITFQPYGFNVPSGGCGGYTGITCGGEQVILDYSYLGTVTDGIPLVQISARSYARIQGLTFQNLSCNGAMQQGIRIDSNSSYIEFNQNRFLNNKNIYPASDGAAALLFFRIWPSNFITVNGNEFGNINTVMSEVLSVGDGATNTLFENNYVHDTDGIAISSWNAANNFSFIGNKVEYIGIRRDGSVWYNNPAVAIYSDGAYAGIIRGNMVSHSGTGYEALSEPGLPPTHDIVISDNIAENCVSAGIVIGTWYSTSSGASVYNESVYNNTFYNNQVGVEILPMTSSSVTWENNIIANNGVNYYNSLNWNPGYTGYNLYYGADVGPGSNNVTSNPQFTNAAGGDFSLLSSSPAINAGDINTPQSVVGPLDFAGNPRIQGGRIDIGAYEMR